MTETGRYSKRAGSKPQERGMKSFFEGLTPIKDCHGVHRAMMSGREHIGYGFDVVDSTLDADQQAVNTSKQLGAYGG